MSDLNENTAKRYPLNISEKQVSKPREHTGGKIDIKTGKPMMMRKIYIPSQEYRPKDVDLGVDANGIDRNERKGYINVPDRHIFVDKKREGRLYTYLSDDRNVKINFSGEKTGRIKNGKPQYDSHGSFYRSNLWYLLPLDPLYHQRQNTPLCTEPCTC